MDTYFQHTLILFKLYSTLLYNIFLVVIIIYSGAIREKAMGKFCSFFRIFVEYLKMYEE